MEFESIKWLWLAVPVLLVAGIWLLVFRSQWKAINSFFGSKRLRFLLPGFSIKRKYLSIFFISSAMLLLVFALGNPRMGAERQEITTESVNLVIALDVSYSMLAEDRSPNRLEVAKQRAIELIDAMPGSRFSILAFAGLGERQLPFTSDRSAVKMAIRSTSAGMLPLQGTSFGQMLSDAAALLSDAGSGVLVVISDGETHDDGYQTALSILSENNYPVFTIGIGTEMGSAIPDIVAGRSESRRDLDGNIIITRMDAEVLRELAFKTGGSLITNPGPMAMQQLAEQINAFSVSGVSQGSFQVYKDYYPWLTFLAIFFLLLYRLIPVFKLKQQE